MKINIGNIILGFLFARIMFFILRLYIVKKTYMSKEISVKEYIRIVGNSFIEMLFFDAEFFYGKIQTRGRIPFTLLNPLDFVVYRFLSELIIFIYISCGLAYITLQ